MCNVLAVIFDSEMGVKFPNSASSVSIMQLVAPNVTAGYCLGVGDL